MAKKSKARKRKSRKSTSRTRPQRPVTSTTSDSTLTVSREATARRTGTARAAQTQVDFAEEYGYVYTDLKRVAIIAAAMLVILVALAFVLA